MNITVNQVNDLGAFAGDLSDTIDEDTSASGTATFTDVADGFTTPDFTVSTVASNGVASIDAAGNWTYTPVANFNGTDSFEISVTDDDGNVETTTITITVDPVVDLMAMDDNFSVNEDATLSDTVADNDSTISGGTLAFALATGPANGSVTVNSDGTFDYTPAADFNGTDSFTYTVDRCSFW